MPDSQTTLSRAEINAMLADMERFPDQYDDLLVMTMLCGMALKYLDEEEKQRGMVCAKLRI